MSEIKSESISSLVDNYAPSNDGSVSSHLVDNLLKDKDLTDTWQNYHLIGDVLRDEVPRILPVDFSETISAAIAQEATILSPNTSVNNATQMTDELTTQEPAQNTSETNNVVDASNRFKTKLANLAKPVGQVAIAASAAVLMIVGVQHNVAENTAPVTPSQVVQTMPFSGYANPVSFDLQSTRPSQSQSNQLQTQQALDEQLAAERLAQKRRLQALLKDHSQQVKIR